MRRRIAVVGCGPAGSAFVLNLLDRGVDAADIVMFDRALFPRPKLCGGGVNWRGTRELERIGGRPAGGAETHGIRMVSRLGTLDVVEPGPQWLFDRGALDAELLDRCRRRGVIVREGFTVRRLEPRRDGWFVASDTVGEEFGWVACCDGAHGFARRATGLKGGRMGRLVEGVFAGGGTDFDDDRLLFDFDPVLDGIPGYAWIFAYPKPGSTQRLYKIGTMDGRGVVPGDRLRRYTRELAARYGFEPVGEIQGWPERYFSVRARGHLPQLVLVGESLGIDPLLGEGITPALIHAAYAARRVKDALDSGRSVIGGYERDFVRTEEGWNLFFHEVLAAGLYGSRPEPWLNILFRSKKLRRMAASGKVAYGQLGRHWAALTGIFLAGVMRPSTWRMRIPVGAEH